jgi:Transposase
MTRCSTGCLTGVGRGVAREPSADTAAVDYGLYGRRTWCSRHDGSWSSVLLRDLVSGQCCTGRSVRMTEHADGDDPPVRWRRGRSGDAEYGIKGLLVRNLEHLRPDQFAKVIGTLTADRHGQEIAAAWIGKEKLRDALNLRARVTQSAPCERDVRGRLASFYDWCAQNDDIAGLLTLARTISRWEDEIVAAVLTGVTNARSEALNRLAKLEARMAYSFRNPANQRRRVRIACTRTARRSRTATPQRSRQVTGRKPDPG